MSVEKFTPIDGRGSGVDRAVELCEAIKAVCYDVGADMALAAVIGTLEIAKLEIIDEHKS